MALRTWWDGNPDQRYWLEITDRELPGQDLHAPQLDGVGSTQWSYEAVSLVQPGDRVLHYQTNEPGGAAIIGWSEAISGASTGTITWQAHGTRGRERAVATTGPSWYVPLDGLHELEEPVRRADLSARMSDVLAVRDDLEAEHGKPVYFPFYKYRPGELRVQQGYLAKFPEELIDLLGLQEVRAGAPATGDDGELTEDRQAPRRKAAKGQVTRIQDPKLRAAIERHAVDVAKAHYRGRGVPASDIVELGKPYDLRVMIDGQERHVEVKGSTLQLSTVELTINEVTHAEDFQPTDLIVVDGIEWERVGEVIKTRRGRMRVWSDWTPLENDLLARKFAYNLPEGESVAVASYRHRSA